MDVERIVRHTDIDSLERAVDTIAFGDVEAEDTAAFTEGNFVKLFRLAQLMVSVGGEYRIGKWPIERHLWTIKPTEPRSQNVILIG